MTKVAHSHALVFGAGHGLGRAVALSVAERGGRLSLFDDPEPVVEARAAELHGCQTLSIEVDLADLDAVEQALARLGLLAPPVDVVVIDLTSEAPMPDTTALVDTVVGPMVVRDGGHLVVVTKADDLESLAVQSSLARLRDDLAEENSRVRVVTLTATHAATGSDVLAAIEGDVVVEHLPSSRLTRRIDRWRDFLRN